MNLFRIASRIVLSYSNDEDNVKISGITYKSAPEYKSVEAFAQYLMDDERDFFTHEDLEALNYRTRTPVSVIRKELEGYGFKLQIREFEKRTRGYTTNDNDRWYGPGSDKTHGGSGFNNFD